MNWKESSMNAVIDQAEAERLLEPIYLENELRRSRGVTDRKVEREKMHLQKYPAFNTAGGDRIEHEFAIIRALAL